MALIDIAAGAEPDADDISIALTAGSSSPVYQRMLHEQMESHCLGF